MAHFVMYVMSIEHKHLSHYRKKEAYTHTLNQKDQKANKQISTQQASTNNMQKYVATVWCIRGGCYGCTALYH